jgi:hypothetical protein
MTYTQVLEYALWKNDKPNSERSPQMTGKASFTCPNCQVVTENISTTAFTNKPDGSNKPLIKGSGSIKTDSPVDTVPVAAAPLDDFDSDLPF